MAKLDQPFNPKVVPKVVGQGNMGVALRYAQAGQRVFPCSPEPDPKRSSAPQKTPLVKWKDEATTDVAAIVEWWTRWPNALVGLVMEDLFAIDCDRHGGPDGVAAFAQLIEQNGAWPDHVPSSNTVSDGVHFFFAQPDGYQVTNSRGGLPDGVDKRGVGGFVIAPGSMWRGSGWRDGDVSLVDAIERGAVPHAPAWLLDLIQGMPIDNRVDDRPPLSEHARAPAQIYADDDEVEFRYIEEATSFIYADNYDTWITVGAALHDKFGPRGRALWDAWSMTSPKYEKPTQDKAWQSFGRPYTGARATVGTIITLARQGGFSAAKHDYAHTIGVPPSWTERVNANLTKQRERQNVMQQPATASVAADVLPPLKLVPMSAHYGKTAPVRRWLIPNWIPAEGEVTGLYGDGGIGKSMLAQMTQAVAAVGLPWFGHEMKETRSIGFYCEDPADELHRRDSRILDWMLKGGRFADREDYLVSQLSGAQICSRIGEDNFLMLFAKNGKGEVTPFRNQIIERALDEQAKLIILDNAATMFPGNMNDPAQVRQFIDIACGQIGQAIGGSVLLCAHPSKSGIESENGDGGSVQWNAAFRSRLYLKRADAEDNSRLVLTRMKGNYADVRSDPKIMIKWSPEGVQVIDAPEGSAFRPPARKIFLDLLDKRVAQGRFVSDKARGSTYAPRIFAKAMFKEACGYNALDFSRAMEDLFADREIERVAVWTGERHRREYILRPGQCTEIRCRDDEGELLDDGDELRALEDAQ